MSRSLFPFREIAFAAICLRRDVCLWHVAVYLSLRGIAKSGSPRDTVYSRGKGVCKHKTTDCRLRQSVGQKRSIRRISRKGHRIIKPTQDTFVLAWRKKAQTSIRVSIAAPDNAISKAQLSGTPRDTVYPWGKGANKQKSEHCRPDNAISTVQFAPRDLHFPPFFDIYCFYFGGVILLDSLFLMLRNLLIFSSYVENKNSFPKPLSREKEAEYVLRAENGDKEATELLIRHNLRLVAHIAKKYCNYPDTDELISIGSIGLIKAIRTYKSGKGTALATYAAKCIENEILMTLRVNKKHKNNVSLNDPVGTDRDGNELTIIDMLSTDEEGVITDVENRMLIEKVSEIVKTSLDKREYEIIVMRYGLNDTPSLTQREVAEKFGISRSYISRIEKKALQKIKSAIEKNDFDFT